MDYQNSTTAADYVVQFSKVVSSSVDDDGVLTYHVAGIGDLDDTEETPEIILGDDYGEVDENVGVYGGLGFIGRPLDPSVESGKSEHAEVLCIRTADGLVPISSRDVRLTMGGVAPKKGTVAFVGYGGGFLSFDAVNDGDDGTIQVLYCPYDFVNGVPQKAHSIQINPDEDSIILNHGDGSAITMYDGDVIIKSPLGLSSFLINDEQVQIAAPKVVLNAGVIIGDPNLAVPLLPGVTSPPCSRLFLSP